MASGSQASETQNIFGFFSDDEPPHTPQKKKKPTTKATQDAVSKINK